MPSMPKALGSACCRGCGEGKIVSSRIFNLFEVLFGRVNDEIGEDSLGFVPLDHYLYT